MIKFKTQVFSEGLKNSQTISCSMGGISSHHGDHLFTKAPSEGRYNKAAVRALLVETFSDFVSTSKYPMKGGNEL
jgi:hypothetical protein